MESRAKFNVIDVLKLFCLSLHYLESINSLLGREMSLGLDINLQTFQCIISYSLLLPFLRFSSKRDEREKFTRWEELVSCACFPALEKYAKTSVCSKVPAFLNLLLRRRTLEL